MALSERHKHDGSSAGGSRIHIDDIQDQGRYLFIPATDFEETDANVALAQSGAFAVLSFADGASAVATTSFMMPAGKKSISSIKLLIRNTTVSSVLRLAFGVSRARNSVADATDTEAEASYTTNAVANSVHIITVPKTAWAGLLQLISFDVIGFSLTRNGASGSDTFAAAMLVYGLLIEFS